MMTAFPSKPVTRLPGNFEFVLYQPAIINGVLWPVGGPNMRIQPSMVSSKGPEGEEKKVYPAHGGELARLLFPVDRRR